VMLKRDGSVLATTGPVFVGFAIATCAITCERFSDGTGNCARADRTETCLARACNSAATSSGRGRYDCGLWSAAEKCNNDCRSPVVRVSRGECLLVFMAICGDQVSRMRPQTRTDTLANLWHSQASDHKLAAAGGHAPKRNVDFCYAVLESESRLALAALGLDPGIGVIHVDAPSRDSFACDLMEAVRPDVDSYLFEKLRFGPQARSEALHRLLRANFSRKSAES
jgi:hypothetical protein